VDGMEGLRKEICFNDYFESRLTVEVIGIGELWTEPYEYELI